jgi:hypothetical protein
MKMIATWFQTGWGLAIGTIVKALTLGKASPYLMRALEETDLAAVVLMASAGAVAVRRGSSSYLRDVGSRAFEVGEEVSDSCVSPTRKQREITTVGRRSGLPSSAAIARWLSGETR